MKKILLCSIFLTSTFANFSTEDEVSAVVNGGNSDVKTYNIKSANKYVFSEKNSMDFKFNYTYGESDGERSAENWDALFRYDRAILKKSSLFISELIEANRFSGYSRRYNTDFGFKHKLIESKKYISNFELSYRYTIEKNVSSLVADKKDSKSRIFADIERKFHTNNSMKLWAEYIPNFSESDDYLVNMGYSLSVILTDTFSLKLSYIWKYDNMPVEGNSTSDYTYTTGIIAKF